MEQELTWARDENESLQAQTSGLMQSAAQASAKCAQTEARLTRLEPELTHVLEENQTLKSKVAGLMQSEAQASAQCAQTEEQLARLELELTHVLEENQTLKSQVETLSGPLAVTVSYAGPAHEVASADSSPVNREQSFVLHASNTLPVQPNPVMRQNQLPSKTPAAPLLGPTTSTIIDNRSMSPLSVQRPSGILGVPPRTPVMVSPSLEILRVVPALKKSENMSDW